MNRDESQLLSAPESLLLFDGHAGALPLVLAFEQRLVQRFPETRRRVRKTQISYFCRYVFACVSFARVKRKAELPETWFTLTLGLPEALASPRVAAQSQVRPGRWTVHLVIGSEAELDEELFAWLARAWEFAERR